MDPSLISEGEHLLNVRLRHGHRQAPHHVLEVCLAEEVSV